MVYNIIEWTTIIHNISIVVMTLFLVLIALYGCFSQTNYYTKRSKKQRILYDFKVNFASFLLLIHNIDLTNDFIKEDKADKANQLTHKQILIDRFLDLLDKLLNSLYDVEEVKQYYRYNKLRGGLMDVGIPLSSQLYVIKRDKKYVDDIFKDEGFIREINLNIQILALNKPIMPNVQDKMFIYLDKQIRVKEYTLFRGLYEYNVHIKNLQHPVINPDEPEGSESSSDLADLESSGFHVNF